MMNLTKRLRKRLSVLILVIALVIGIVPISTVPVEAASQADDIVRIAELYVGKNLSQTKDAMRANGHSMWNANYNSYWCAWFVSNCARQAGISTSIVENNVTADRNFYINNGTYKPAKYYGGSYTPVKGDLIFFDWWEDEEGGRNNLCDHIGIVKSVSNGRVYTVEGNSSGRVRNDNSYSLDSADIRGYAHSKYKDVPQTYTVKYNANGGSGSMSDQKITYGVSTKLTANAYTKKGYKFIGWAAKRNDGPDAGKYYYIAKDKSAKGWYEKCPNEWIYNLYLDEEAVSKTTIAGYTVTMYAQWEPNTYTVTFRPNGGTGEMADQTFIYDKANQPLNPNKYVRAGYEFKGWECVVLDEKDGKDWGRYISPDKSENKWYVVGEQPEGWTFHLYGDQSIISRTTYKDQGVCVFTAHWEKVAIPGDVNMDGEVDIRDVTRLLRYIKYKNKEVDEKAVDINGDGELDIRDVTRLLRCSKYKNKEIYYDGVKYDPTA